jgi:hypothetical protein
MPIYLRNSCIPLLFQVISLCLLSVVHCEVYSVATSDIRSLVCETGYYFDISSLTCALCDTSKNFVPDTSNIDSNGNAIACTCADGFAVTAVDCSTVRTNQSSFKYLLYLSINTYILQFYRIQLAHVWISPVPHVAIQTMR